MIRLIYWFAVLVEFILVLAVLIIFIITDARTIKLLAKESLINSQITYKTIEGNFLTGLTLKELSYKNKKILTSASVHWNPLALLSHKITLTDIRVEDLNLKNTQNMFNDFKTTSSSKLSLPFSFSLNNIHIDINSYFYEGVKFSSFIFETKEINISKRMLVNSKNLYLSFHSTIVGVTLLGKIKESKLLVKKLRLKEIDSKKIRQFIKKIKKNKSLVQKNKSIKSFSLPFKKIKIERIFATLKDVSYLPLTIKNTKLTIFNAEINPKNFNYNAKKVKFSGVTNFGKVKYKGYIKNSIIMAKGELLLSSFLFEKYSLPLNYKGLKTLPGTLKLNHKGVWLDINHQVEALLHIKNDFNLDVLKAEHHIHYNYKDKNLTIKSRLSGQMPYSDDFNIKNEIIIDKKGFRYAGVFSTLKVNNIEYKSLLKNLKVSFRGNKLDFKSTIISDFTEGTFTMKSYKNGILSLNSKEEAISLLQFSPNVPTQFKNEKVSFNSKVFFNFKEMHHSKLELDATSNLINLKTSMSFYKPYQLFFIANVPHYSLLKEMNSNINFTKHKIWKGSIVFDKKLFMIKLINKNLELSFDYDLDSQMIQNALLTLGQTGINFSGSLSKGIILKSKIKDIHKFLNYIKEYYHFTTPDLAGEASLTIKKTDRDWFTIHLKSPKLTYLADIIFYDFDILFKIDKEMNIQIEKYKFKMDENEYLSSFFSSKKSFFSIKENRLIIKELWINDLILLKGSYNFLMKKGTFRLNSNHYNFQNKDFDLLFDINLIVKTENTKIDISGDIDIFGNTINYEMIGSDIVEDADIIIVQDILENKNSSFNNLKFNLKIKSKKALKYVSKDTNIEFFNELNLIKNYNEKLLLTGMTTISKGYYEMEDKQFILDESHIYFAGDPKKPLLDIKANYEKDHYIVHIFISGSSDEPIVNFNSEPYLTQQEILSLILFDGTGTSSGDGAEAYTLLGGTFAKGLIKSLGINVDHLLLGRDKDDDLSFEIGRKISKNITVMYVHEDGKDGAKVRIEHNKNFETDIIIQPPNTSSIEFLYKSRK